MKYAPKSDRVYIILTFDVGLNRKFVIGLTPTKTWYTQELS